MKRADELAALLAATAAIRALPLPADARAWLLNRLIKEAQRQ